MKWLIYSLFFISSNFGFLSIDALWSYHSNSKNMINFPIFHKDHFIKHKPLNFWRVTSFRSCFSLFFTHNFGSSGYRMHDWEYMWIRLRPIFDDGCNFQTRLLLLGMKKENAAKGSFFWTPKSGHEFKEFPTKKQASDWLTYLVYQLEVQFWAVNHLNSCPDSRSQKNLPLVVIYADWLESCSMCKNPSSYLY